MPAATNKNNMKKTLIIILLALSAAWPAFSQTARQKIEADAELGACTYRLYPVPTVAPTPAPKGYKAFYISHYGRHGSRWLTARERYENPRRMLLQADSAGVLTPYGKDVLGRLGIVSEAADLRYGDLTLKGAEQHRGIARRMYENYPSVFADSARVDARSTTVIRCILSMGAGCRQLSALNPALRITNDASNHDMYYMNCPDKDGKFAAIRKSKKYRKAVEEFEGRHLRPARLMKALFSDTSFITRYSAGGSKKSDRSNALYQDLFELMCDMPNTDCDVSFDDVFTAQERHDLFAVTNMNWYMYHGSSPLSDSAMPFRQADLLNEIIDTADSVIVARLHGATLRFGHDSIVMPLAVLLELGNCGYSTADLEQLADNWNMSEIVPMAANIQFVFYSNDAGHVIVKVLLNEREAKLPLTTDMAPYYDWESVRAYYKNKLRNSPI